MKTFLFVLSLFSFVLSYSQSPKEKIPRDSIKYYQKEMKILIKEFSDSMIHSEKYQMIVGKLSRSNSKNFGVELSFLFGYQINKFENLNSRLDSLKIKKIKPLSTPIGVGLGLRFNKVIVGFDMASLFGNNASGFIMRSYISTNLIKLNRWIISPQFGYGLQTYSKTMQVLSTSSNFNDYFTSSANKVEIKHNNTFLDFAVAFKVYPKKSNEFYLPLIKFGYHYGLKEKNWEIADGNSFNAPNDRNNNFYLSLILGFGS